MNGVLTDEAIRAEAANGNLISANFESDNARGASYEFRVGDTSYLIDHSSRRTVQRQGNIHEIRPLETVTIVTFEEVSLDERHVLFIQAKGSLFTLGITPIATTADPGFRGQLGLTFTNISSRTVTFQTGDAFAKGMFIRLVSPAAHRYHGAHGAAQLAWPYPSQFHSDQIEGGLARHLPTGLRQLPMHAESMARQVRILVVGFVLSMLGVHAARVAAFVDYASDAVTVSDVNIERIGTVGSIASVLSVVLAVAFFLVEKRRYNREASLDAE